MVAVIIIQDIYHPNFTRKPKISGAKHNGWDLRTQDLAATHYLCEMIIQLISLQKDR